MRVSIFIVITWVKKTFKAGLLAQHCIFLNYRHAAWGIICLRYNEGSRKLEPVVIYKFFYRKTNLC